jgi:hypothetical protein
MKRKIEDAFFWVAKRLPQRLRYFVLVTVIADATTGEYGNTNPTELSAMELLDRTPGSLA